MQGPAYQEKEHRAATWNVAGCGSGLSVSDMELVRCKSRPCGRKRKDSTEGAVVVVNAYPPRTPHDQMERISRPFADEQLDVSIDSLAKNVVFFPLYYMHTSWC
jgi:hypothetical protein